MKAAQAVKKVGRPTSGSQLVRSLGYAPEDATHRAGKWFTVIFHSNTDGGTDKISLFTEKGKSKPQKHDFALYATREDYFRNSGVEKEFLRRTLDKIKSDIAKVYGEEYNRDPVSIATLGASTKEFVLVYEGAAFHCFSTRRSKWDFNSAVVEIETGVVESDVSGIEINYNSRKKFLFRADHLNKGALPKAAKKVELDADNLVLQMGIFAQQSGFVSTPEFLSIMKGHLEAEMNKLQKQVDRNPFVVIEGGKQDDDRETIEELFDSVSA